MRLLRRLVGVVVLVLSALGTICCVAGIIGVWTLYQGVSERVQRITNRVDTGLEPVSAANQNAQLAVVKARAGVADVGKESAELSGGGAKGRPAARTIRTLIQQQAGPDVDALGGRLATLSDSAAALSSLLESFQDVPLARVSRIDSDQLQRRADEAQRLSSMLRRLEVALDDGDTKSGRQEVAGATKEVDLVLEKCQATVTDWQSDLDGVRDDVARVKGQMLGWLTCAAIAVTVVCSWVGAGQISLFAHGLRWCKRR